MTETSDMRPVVLPFGKAVLVEDNRGRLHVLRAKKISRDEVVVEWGDVVVPGQIQTIDKLCTND